VRFVVCLSSLVALVLAFAGCETTRTPIAPPVTPAMAKSGRAQEADLRMLNSGRDAFVNRCAACHVLPGVNEHSRAEWSGLVAKMEKRSGLTPGQREAVVAYLLAAHSN